MTHWRRYIARRLLLAAITVLGVITAVFLLTHILPGNPALVRAGQFADERTVRELEKQMGLDKPLYVQFGTYLVNLTQGNFGQSYTSGHPVTADLKHRVPATVELALYSFLIAMVVALPLGVAAALKRGGWADRLCTSLVVGGASIPVFWLALMLVYLFYFQLGVVKAPTGRLDNFMDAPRAITHLYTIDALLTGNWAVLKSALAHLLLPSLSMAFIEIAPLAKVTRTAMGQVLGADYILSARAMGIPDRQIALRDALQNAMVPVVTMIGLVLGYLMAASVLVERIFSWPGLGQYGWNALMANDFDAIQGFVLVVGITYVFINIAVDVLYSIIDPRIRLD